MAYYAKQLKVGEDHIYPYSRSLYVYMNSNVTVEDAYATLLSRVDEFSSTRGFIQFYDKSEIPTDEREPNTLYGRIIADYSE